MVAFFLRRASSGSSVYSTTSFDSEEERDCFHEALEKAPKNDPNIEGIIKAFQTRDDTQDFGAQSLACQFVYPSHYEELAEQTRHLRRRLEFYQEKMGSGTDSGIWQVLVGLFEIHLEHEHGKGSDFLISLVKCLDMDVRACLKEVQKEVHSPNSAAPWTDQGKKAERSLLDHLFQTSSDRTTIDLLEDLRQKKVPHGKHSDCAATHGIIDTAAEVRCRLLPDNSWWHEGSVPRALSIGLKDLWKNEDWKALLYILKKAGKLRNEDLQPRPGPFAWTFTLCWLVGPHITKFNGDSDANAELWDRLQSVRTCVLPHFVQRLMRLEAVLQQDQKTIHAIRASLLTTAGAIMAGISNSTIHYFLNLQSD